MAREATEEEKQTAQQRRIANALESIDNRDKVTVDATGGALATVISPLTGFGEVRVAVQSPIAQIDAVYGLLDNVETRTSTGGSVGVTDGNFVCQTGTSVGGYGLSLIHI